MNATDLPQERRQKILEELRINGKVVATEVSARYGVSEDTIRRDLRELAAAGLLKRVHGGALPIVAGRASFLERDRAQSQAKTALAQAATSLVQDGQLILFGGGSTNAEIARHLPVDLRATAVTHSPQIALLLAGYRHLEVILVGGRLNKTELVATDAGAVAQMQQFQADLCFLGVCSLHPEIGLTANDYEETSMARTLIAQSADVIATVTADKLGAVTPYVVAPVKQITQLVTEGQVTEEALAPYRAQGIQIVQAG